MKAGSHLNKTWLHHKLSPGNNLSSRCTWRSTAAVCVYRMCIHVFLSLSLLSSRTPFPLSLWPRFSALLNDWSLPLTSNRSKSDGLVQHGGPFKVNSSTLQQAWRNEDLRLAVCKYVTRATRQKASLFKIQTAFIGCYFTASRGTSFGYTSRRMCFCSL